MKLITKAWATAFIHASADEVCPEKGLLQKDLIDFIAEAYSFAMKPNIPPGMEAVPTLAFRSGKFVHGNDAFPIQQIVAYINGDAVTAASSEIANLILDDYIGRLDSGLGYKYANRSWKRTQASGLVVEFDEGFEKRISVLGKVEDILNRRMPRPGNPFGTKTVAFGFGDPTGNMTLTAMDTSEKMDFVLQRRAGSPYSSNRFFSTAPLSTDDHVAMLEEIERTVHD